MNLGILFHKYYQICPDLTEKRNHLTDLITHLTKMTEYQTSLTGFLLNNDQIDKILRLPNQWFRGSLGERNKDVKSSFLVVGMRHLLRQVQERY
jgi:hypothetical protein